MPISDMFLTTPTSTSSFSGSPEPTEGFAEGVVNIAGNKIIAQPRSMLDMDDDPFGARVKAQAKEKGLPDPGADYVDSLLVFGKRYAREDLMTTQWGSDLLKTATRNRRGKKGFIEGLSEDYSLSEVLPYVNDLSSIGSTAMDMVQVRDTFEKMQNGQPITDEEAVKTRLYMARAERDSAGNWGNTVGSIVRAAPAFALEMYATAQTAGASLTASVGTRASSKALTAAAKKQMSLFTREALGEVLEEAATKAGTKLSKETSSALAGKLDDAAVRRAVTKSVEKMALAKESSEELAEFMTQAGAKESLVEYGIKVAQMQKNNLADPSLFRAAKDFVAEYAGRALTEHGASALWSMPKAKGDLAREVLGNWLIEAPVRGALYMGFDQGVVHPIVGAFNGQGLGFDTTATQSENQLRMSAMVRGDRGLMENAHAVSLGMAWMEYSSEMTGRGFKGVLDRVKVPIRGMVKDVASNARLEGSLFSKMVELDIGSDKAIKAKLAEKSMAQVQRALDGEIELPGFKDLKSKGFMSAQEAVENMPELGKAAYKVALDQEKGIKFFQLWAAEKMVNNGLTPAGVNKMFRNFGYDDLVEEMLEERYNGFAQGMFGFTDQDHEGVAKHLALMGKGLAPTFDQFSAELVSFALPGVARSSLFRAQAALGAGKLGMIRDTGEMLGDMLSEGVGALVQGKKTSEAAFVEIKPADENDPSFKTSEEFGRVAGSPSRFAANYNAVLSNLAEIGKIYAENKDTQTASIWRRGASSVLGVINATISGNPMLAFADPFMATMKDYNMPPKLLSDISSAYQSFITTARTEAATAQAAAAAAGTPVDGGLGRDELSASVEATYKKTIEVLLNTELARAGVRVISDDDVKKQVELIKETTKAPLTDNEGNTISDEDFTAKYREDLKAVLSGNARAIRSGTNLRFEYYSIRGEEGGRLVSDALVRDSIAQLLGMKDMFSVKSVARGESPVEGLSLVSPISAELFKSVAEETDGSPMTPNTLQLITMTSANAMSSFHTNGGPNRLAQRAAEMRLASRAVISAKKDVLKPFYASFDDKSRVRASFRVQKVDGGFQAYDVYSPSFAVNTETVYDTPEEVVLAFNTAASAFSNKVDEANKLSSFAEKTPQIHFTTNDLLQLGTSWEALAAVGDGYKTALGARSLSFRDPEYAKKLERQFAEDERAARYQEHVVKGHSDEYLLGQYTQEELTAMQESYEARFGKDGYEAIKNKILASLNIAPTVNAINPGAGSVYRVPLTATSTVDNIYLPVKFLDGMTALLEETVETALRAKLGIVLDADPTKKEYVAPVQLIVNRAKELCISRAEMYESRADRAQSSASQKFLLDRANNFRQLADNLLTRVSADDVNIESFSKLAVGVAMFRGDMYLANGSVDTQTKYYAEIGDIADDLRKEEAFPAFASIVDRVMGGVGFTDPAHTSVEGLLPLIKQFQKASPEADKVYAKAFESLSGAAKGLREFCKTNKIPYDASRPSAEVAHSLRSSAKGGEVKQAPEAQKSPAATPKAEAPSNAPGDNSVARNSLVGAAVGAESKASMQSVVDTDTASLVFRIFSLMNAGGDPSKAVKDTISVVDPTSSEDTVRVLAAIAQAKLEQTDPTDELEGNDGSEGEETANGDLDDDPTDAVHETREGKHEFTLLTNQLVATFSKVMGWVYPAINNHPVSIKKMLISEVSAAPAQAEMLVGMLSPFLRTTELEQHGSMAEPGSEAFKTWKTAAMKAVASSKVDASKFEMLFGILGTMSRAEKLNLFHRLGSAVALEGSSISWSWDKKVSFEAPSSRVATGKVYEALASGIAKRLEGAAGEKLWSKTLGTQLNNFTTLGEKKSEHEGYKPNEFAKKYLSKKRGEAGASFDEAAVLEEFVARGKELADLTDLIFNDGNPLSEALRDRRTWREALSKESRFESLVEDFMFTTSKAQNAIVNLPSRSTFHPHVIAMLKDIREKIIKASTNKAGAWKPATAEALFAKILGPLSTNATSFVIESESKSAEGTGAWLRGFATILNSYASVNPPTSTKKPGTTDSMPLVQAGTSAAFDMFLKSDGFLALNQMLPGAAGLKKTDLAFKAAQASGTYIDGTPVIGNVVGEMFKDSSGNTTKTNSEAAPSRAYEALKSHYESGKGDYVMISLPTGDRKRCVVLNLPRAATKRVSDKTVFGFKDFTKIMFKRLNINRMEAKRHPFIVGNGFAFDVPGETTVAVVANGFDKGVGESTNGMMMMFGKIVDLHNTVSADKGMEGKYHFYHGESGEFFKSAQVGFNKKTQALGDANMWKALAYGKISKVWTDKTTGEGSLLATDMANIKTGYLAASVTVGGSKMKLVEYIVKLHKENGSDETKWEPSEKAADGSVTKESLLDTAVKATFKGGAVVEGKLGELLPKLRVSNVVLDGQAEEWPVITYSRANMRMQEAANLHKSAKPKFNKIGVNLVKDSVHLYGMGKFIGRYGLAKLALASKIFVTDRMKLIGDSAQAKLRSLTTLGWGAGSGPFEAAFAKSGLSALRNMARVESYGLISVQASSGMRVVSIDENGEPVLDSVVGNQHDRDMLYMPRAIVGERAALFDGQTSVSGLARANVIDSGSRYLMWAKGDGQSLVSEFGTEFGEHTFRNLLAKVVLRIVEEDASGKPSDTRARFFGCFASWDGASPLSDKEVQNHMLGDLVYTGKDGATKFDFTALFDENIALLTKPDGGKGVALAGSPALVSRTPSYNNGANAAVVRFSTPYSQEAGRVMDTAIVVLDPLTDFRLGTDHDGDKITMEMLKASKGVVSFSDLSSFTIEEANGEHSLAEKEAASNFFVQSKLVAVRNPDLRQVSGATLQDGQALVYALNSNPVSAEPLSSEGMVQLKGVRDAMFAKIKEATGVDLTFKLDMLDPKFMAWLTGDAIDTSKARGIGVMLINFINDAKQLGLKVADISPDVVATKMTEYKDSVIEALAKKGGKAAGEFARFFDSDLTPVLQNVLGESGMLRDELGKSYSNEAGAVMFKPQAGHESMDSVSWSLKAKVFDGVNNAMFDALKELLAPSLGWNTTGVEPLFMTLFFSNYTTEAQYTEHFSKFVQWYYTSGYDYVKAQRYRSGLEDGKGLLLQNEELPSVKKLSDMVSEDAKAVEALHLFSEGARMLESLTPGAILGSKDRKEELAQMVVASVKAGNTPKVAAIKALSFFRLLVTSAGFKAAVEGLSPERFKLRDISSIRASDDVMKTAALSQEGIGIEIPPVSDELKDRLETGRQLLATANEIAKTTMAAQAPVLPKKFNSEARAPIVANSLAATELLIRETGDERASSLLSNLSTFSGSVKGAISAKLGIEALVSAAIDASGKAGDTPISLSNIRLPSVARNSASVLERSKQNMTLRAPDASLGIKQAIVDSIDRMLSGEEDKTRAPVSVTGDSGEVTVSWRELGHLIGLYGASSASDVDLAPNTVLSMFSPAYFSAMSYSASKFTGTEVFVKALNEAQEEGRSFEMPGLTLTGGSLLAGLEAGGVEYNVPSKSPVSPVKPSGQARDNLVNKLTRAEAQFKSSTSNSEYTLASSMVEAAGQMIHLADSQKVRPSAGPGAYEQINKEDGQPMMDKAFAPASSTQVTFFKSMLDHLITAVASTHEVGAAIDATVDYLKFINTGMRSGDGLVAVDPTVIKAGLWLSRAAAIAAADEGSVGRLNARFSLAGIEVPTAEQEASLALLLEERFNKLGVKTFAEVAALGQEGRVELASWVVYTVNQMSQNPNEEMLNADLTQGLAYARGIARSALEKGGQIKTQTKASEEAEEVVEPIKEAPAAIVVNPKEAVPGTQIKNVKGAVAAKKPSAMGSFLDIPASFVVEADTPIIPETGAPVAEVAEVLSMDAVAATASRETTKAIVKPKKTVRKPGRTPQSRIVINQALRREEGGLASAVDKSVSEPNSLLLSLNGARVKEKGSALAAILEPEKDGEPAITTTKVLAKRFTLADIYNNPEAAAEALAQEVVSSKHITGKGFSLALGSNAFVELKRQAESEKIEYSQEGLYKFADELVGNLKKAGLKKLSVFNLSGLNYLVAVAGMKHGITVDTHLYDMYAIEKMGTTAGKFGADNSNLLRESKILQGFSVHYQEGANLMKFQTQLRARMEIDASAMDDMSPEVLDNGSILEPLSFKNKSHLRSMKMLEAVRRVTNCLDLFGGAKGLKRTAYSPMQRDNLTLLERTLDVVARTGQLSSFLPKPTDVVKAGEAFVIRSEDMDYGDKRTVSTNATVTTGTVAVIFQLEAAATTEEKLANPIQATVDAMKLSYVKFVAPGTSTEDILARAKASGADSVIVFSPDAGRVIVKKERASVDYSQEFKFYAVTDRPVSSAKEIEKTSPVLLGATVGASSNALLDIMYKTTAAEAEVDRVLTETFQASKAAPRWNDVFSVIDRIFKSNGLEFKKTDTADTMAKALIKFYEEQQDFANPDNEFRKENWALTMAGALMRMSHGYGYHAFDRVVERLNEQLAAAIKTGDGRLITAAERANAILAHISSYGYETSDLEIVEEDVVALKKLSLLSGKEDASNAVKALVDPVAETLMLLANYKYHVADGRIAHVMEPWMVKATVEALPAEEEAVLANIQADRNMIPVHRQISYKIADYDAWFNHFIRPTFNGASVREIMTDGSVKAGLMGLFDDLNFEREYCQGDENSVLRRITKGISSLGSKGGKIGKFEDISSEYEKMELNKVIKGANFTALFLDRNAKDEKGNIVEDSKGLMKFVMSEAENVFIKVRDTGRSQSAFTGAKLRFSDFLSRHETEFAQYLTNPEGMRLAVAEFFSDANIKRRKDEGTFSRRLDLDVAIERIHEYIPLAQYKGRSLEQVLRNKIIEAATMSLTKEEQEVSEILYKTGWAAKQNSTKEGKPIYTNLVLTVPMEVIEEVYENSFAKKKLIEAGRDPEKLSLKAIATRTRALAARVHRTSTSLPWITKGLGAGLTAANSSSPFIRGSAIRDYSDRREVIEIEKTPQEMIDKETESMLRSVASSLVGVMDENGQFSQEKKTIDKTPPRMIRFMLDLYNMGNVREDLFVEQVKAGDFVDGKHGFVLNANASMADLAGLIYSKSTEELYAQIEGTGKARKTIVSGIPLQAFTKAYEAAIQANEFKNGVPGLTSYQAYERDGSLPAGNYSALDRIQLYANEVLAAEELRGTLAQMLMTTDQYSNPLYLAKPALGMEAEDAIPDEMWGVLARWWSSSFGVNYDLMKSGRENASEIYDHVAGLQMFQGGSKVQYSERGGDRVEVTGYHHMTETGLSTVSGFLCRLDEPWDDTKAALNTLSHGEAAGMLSQLLQAKKSVYTSSFSSVLDHVLAWSKSLSVTGSVFFTIATTVESPMAAIGLSFWKWFNKDPNFVGMKDILKLIGTNDPFLKQLKVLAVLQGVPLSDRTKNPIEHFNKGAVDRDIRALTMLTRKNLGDKAADGLNAALKGAMMSSSEYAFEYLINATTLAVMAQMNNKFRARAIAQGKAWDPVYNMKKWASYISAEVGGVNPAIMPFMTPKVQRVLAMSMFSWPWTIGAWLAGGGDVLTQKWFGQTSNPAVRQFMFGRWLRMYGGVMIGLPIIVQIVSKAIAKAAGDDDDEDKWFTWQNEAKANLSAGDITPALKAIAKIPYVAGFKASGGYIDALPEWANAIIRPVTWTAAKMLPVYTGTDTTNTTGRRRIYFHLGKQGWEVLRWFEDTWSQLVSKLAMPVQKTADAMLGYSMGSGYAMPWKEQSLGEKLTTFRGDSAWKHFLSSFVPFSFQGMVDKGDVGALGMVGPTAYGVGQSAAIANMEKVLAKFADPEQYAQVYSSKNMYNDLIARVRNEMQDAERNGLDPERMLSFALGQARAPYYRKVYDAIPKTPSQEPDEKELDTAMRSLYRLWFTERQLMSSVKSRLGKTNTPFETMDPELRAQILHAVRSSMGNPTGEEDAQRAVRRVERGGRIGAVDALTTDVLPQTVLGYRIVGPEHLSMEDEMFFDENPEAAGFYSMSDDDSGPKQPEPPTPPKPSRKKRALVGGGETNLVTKLPAQDAKPAKPVKQPDVAPPPPPGYAELMKEGEAPKKDNGLMERAYNYIEGTDPKMDKVVNSVLDAMITAEGNAKPDEVGDTGRALGTRQMWKIAVDEANRIVGKDVWTEEDRSNPQQARAMAKATLGYHYRRGVTDPVELGAKWRNPYGKEAPNWYKAKVRKGLDKQKK